MAKVKFETWMKGIRGKVGDFIYRLMPDGSTVVSQAPQGDHRDFSKKQLDHQRRFQQAAAYARQAAQHQPIYAELAAAAPLRTAYNFAVSDWWHAPVIHRVERRDGRIFVQATDNMLVTRVQVKLLDDAGNVLEKGEAVRGEGDWWELTTQADSQAKTVIAEAWDLPEHVTRFVL